MTGGQSHHIAVKSTPIMGAANPLSANQSRRSLSMMPGQLYIKALDSVLGLQRVERHRTLNILAYVQQKIEGQPLGSGCFIKEERHIDTCIPGATYRSSY